MLAGIDIGGTNIVAGILDENNTVIAKESTPTNQDGDFMKTAKLSYLLCSKLCDNIGITLSSLKGIGVGTAGAVDSNNGIVRLAANLNWINVPLRAEFEKLFLLPVKIENDANAAAYGEFSICSNEVENFIAITLGTGVGGGIIINRQLYRGLSDAGGEIGHFSIEHNGIKCTCGRHGCFEAYASATALIRMTRESLAQNHKSIMTRIAAESGGINGRTAFDGMRLHDETAIDVVDKYISYLSDGIASLINIFRPDVIVLGGGISNEGDFLLNPIREYLKRNVFCPSIPFSTIKTAQLGSDAGIIGAALLSNV